MIKMPWKSVLVSLVLVAMIASLVGSGVASPVRADAAFAGTTTQRILVLVHGSAGDAWELPVVKEALEKWGYPVEVFDRTEYYDLSGAGGHWYLDDQGGGHGDLDLVLDGNMLYSTIIFDPHDGEAYTDIETSSRAVKQMFQEYPFLGIARMEAGYAWGTTNNAFQVSTDGNSAKSLTVSNPAGTWALEPLVGYERSGSDWGFCNVTGKTSDVTALESFGDGTPALTLASYASGARAIYFAFKDWGYAAHASMLVRLIQQYSGIPYIKPYYALEIDDCGRGELKLAGYTSLCSWTNTNLGGYPTFGFMESYLDSDAPEGIMVWGLDPTVHTNNTNYDASNVAILAALGGYQDYVVASHGYQHDVAWWIWTATGKPVDPYADTDGDGLVNWQDSDLEGVGASNSANPNLTMFEPGAFVMPDLAVQTLWLQRMREVLNGYGYSAARVLILPKYEYLDGYTQELASEYGFSVLSGRASNENFTMTLGWVDGTYAPGRVAPSGTGTDRDVALTAAEQESLAVQFMGYAGTGPLVLVNFHDWQFDQGSTTGYQLRDSYLSSYSVMKDAGFSLVSTQAAANKNVGWLWTDMTSVLNSSGSTSLTLSSSSFQDGRARHELDIVMPSSIKKVKVGSNYWIYVDGKNLFYGKQSGTSETLEVSNGTYDSSLPRITSVSTPATDVLNAVYDPVSGKISLMLDGTFSTTLGISNFQKPFSSGTTTIGSDGNATLSLGLSGVASVDSVNMSIVPSASDVDVAVGEWSTSGDRLRRWSESYSFSLFGSAAHTMGDLVPGKSYKIWYTKDSGSRTYWQTLQANAAGQISFTYSPGFTTTTQFELQAVPDAGPTANFSGTPTSGSEPLTVAFTDSSTSSDGVASWLWAFGDGQTSTEQNPTHIYTDNGTYTVTLTVTEADDGSDAETKTGYVAVSDAGPAAEFSVAPASGTEPLTVLFTDNSTSHDGIASWLWEFGDGQASTERHPSHVYAQEGVYTVTLTVTEADTGSDAETKAGCVTVSGTGPAADFSATPLSGGEPLTVVFTDNSTSYDGIASWLWDFGDGVTSAEQNPTHVYAQDGVYTVTLTVTEADADSDAETKAGCVTVSGTGPAADFSATPLSGTEPLTVVFTDNSTSYDGIAAWLWDFGDGQTSTDQNPTHVYAQEGVYTVTLTVTEADTDSDAETKAGYITVSGTGPAADFSATPLSGTEPLTVVFTDNSTSYDGIVSWLWDFGDGATSPDQNPAHVYAQEGVYTVTLTVTEADADSDAETKAGYITVSGTGPAADFSATPLSGTEPLTVVFTDNSTSYDGIVSWLWDFGDGQTSTDRNPTHVYAQDGTYPVTLTVTEADADSDAETKAGYVTVSGTGPAADFSATPLSGGEPLTVVFTDNSTSYDGIVSWLWDFGDGATSTEQNPSHVYAQNGTYTVTLTVAETDTDSDAETKAGYITVSGTGPAADFSATPLSGTEPLTVVFTDNSTSYDGIAAWLWDFGDGQTSTDQNPAHVYAQEGVYTVTLTVTEADTGSDAETKADYIAVSDVGPSADFSAVPVSGFEPLTVVFSDLSVSNDGIVSWLWDFGDGQTSTQRNPSHVYAQDGSYTVTLTVTEADTDADSENRLGYIDVAPDTTPPTAPILVSPANGRFITDNTPYVDWSDVTDTSGVHYQIQVDNSSGFASTEFSRTWVTASSCVVTTELPRGAYYWRVRVVDGLGNTSDWTVAWFFTVSPSAPVLISPSNGKITADSNPYLDWSDVIDPSGVHYEIQVDNDAGFASTEFSRTWVTASSCVVTTALADGTYYWRVRAVDGAGVPSDWTGARSLRVDSTAPPVPALVSPSSGKFTADSTPWVDWSDVYDVSGVHYEIQVDNDAGFASPEFSRTWVNASSCVVTTALADGTYYWRVRAVDGAGNTSAWSAAWTAGVDTIAPAGAVLTSPSNGSVTTDRTPWVDWSDVSHASTVRYQIQVDNDPGFTSAEFSRTSVSASSCVVTTVLADGIYYWRVRVVDAAGNTSPWTAAGYFTVDTTAPPVPVPLSPAAGTATSDNTTLFDWADVTDATGAFYQLQVSDNVDFVLLVVNQSWLALSSYAISTELAEGTYYWRVRAVDVAGNTSAWSSVWSFAVDTTIPSVPTLLSPADGAVTVDGTPLLVWSEVTDATGVVYEMLIDDSADFSSTLVSEPALAMSFYDVTTALAPGTYRWKVRVVDGAGNTSAWTATWSLTVQ